MVHLAGRVFDRCKNILPLEERVVFKDFLKGCSCAEEVENIRDAEALAPNARTPPALARLDGDTLKQFGFHAKYHAIVGTWRQEVATG